MIHINRPSLLRRLRAQFAGPIEIRSGNKQSHILSGIEMVHMMRKRQAKFACDPTHPIAKQFAILVA